MTVVDAPLRLVVERIGRHAVRLDCGHVDLLAVGEAGAIGRRLPCVRCALAGDEGHARGPTRDTGTCQRRRRV
jgi:hypothetical protein